MRCQEGAASHRVALSARLLVRDGDHVARGDVVVRLDETVLRANLAIYTKGLDEMRARKARLDRPSETAPEPLHFPTDLLDAPRCRTFASRAGQVNASCSN